MSSKILIEYARKFIGVPYVLNGTTPDGFDCSGFIQYIYKHALGIDISRQTKTQINDGREVSKNELQPGDLVFPKPDHVTLYFGNNQVIHSPQPGERIKISKMWAFWRARRILNDLTLKIGSVFVPDFYIRKYPDLKKAFGDDSSQLLKHFENFGIIEGRSASPAFDVSYYLNSNEDLKKAFNGNYKEAYNHFISCGYNEDRDLSPVFHLGFYKNNNPDVVKSFGNDTDSIMNHFLIHGMKEGRLSSPNFNINAYKSNYADLRNEFRDNNKEYYIHYCIFGKNEGRNAK